MTTNGFKASEPSVPQAGHALKPMVLKPRISTVKPFGEMGETENPSAKEPMVDVQTDLFFGRHVRLFEQNCMIFRFVWQRTNPSVHQPLVLWQTDFNMLKSIFEASDPSNASILTMNKNQGF